MAPRTALIAGATGLVGAACLAEILRRDAYARVTAVGRRPPPAGHPRLTPGVIPLDRLDSAGDALCADDVFCCLGTTIGDAGSRDAFRAVDYGYPLALARAAKAAGARRFLVVSSIGADAASPAFYLRVKGEMERDLRAVGYGVLDIFRPSLLLGERARPRPGERAAAMAMRTVGPLLIGRLARYRPVDAAAVGRAMVARALEPHEGVAVHFVPDIVRLDAGGRA